MKRAAASPTPTRSRLTPMRVSPRVRDFILDQLSNVPALSAKAMFGGVGLYSGDQFFGIIAADVLYFKVGDSNRLAFDAAGSMPFRPYADRAMTMPYYNVPISILEDALALTAWAEDSIKVASSLGKNTRRRRRTSASA